MKLINTPKLNNIFLLPFNFLKILFFTIKSIILLKKQKVNKLISTGGYMSLPLCLSARLLGLDIYLVEPNFVLGRANKFFLNFCRKIFCYSDKIKNFPDNFKNKIIIIKPLVRKEFYQKSENIKKNEKFNLLIVGGSQGASFFDNNFKSAILKISKKKTLKILHQTSLKNLDNLKSFYNKNNIENYIFSFENEFAKILHQSDLCITRAGASSLAELSILNIPFIVIPLPSAKDNHQFENAIYYEKNDCCWILNQSSSDKEIEDNLSKIIEDRNEYKKKRKNLKNLNYENTWNNVNEKLLNTINEN